MGQISVPVASPTVASIEPRRWPAVPSWLVSITFHALLLILIGLRWTAVPRGAAVEGDRDVGVVLKRVDEQGETFFQSESDATVAATSREAGATSDVPASIVGPASPVDASAALPQSKPLIGLGSSGASPPSGASGLTQGSGGSTRGVGKAGAARTRVYGLEGEGFKFVYVFDRSASMGNERYSPLLAAKAELLQSLSSLSDLHQFQIIFFNHEPKSFALSGLAVQGPAQRLAFATEGNRQQARRFVESITADGGTEYLPALDLALGMGPDVVFFLTDAGTPMSEGQIGHITSRNRNAAVLHIIEFGEGPATSQSTLMQLARQNHGRYLYVDITQGRAAP